MSQFDGCDFGLLGCLFNDDSDEKKKPEHRKKSSGDTISKVIKTVNDGKDAIEQIRKVIPKVGEIADKVGEDVGKAVKDVANKILPGSGEAAGEVAGTEAAGETVAGAAEAGEAAAGIGEAAELLPLILLPQKQQNDQVMKNLLWQNQICLTGCLHLSILAQK